MRRVWNQWPGLGVCLLFLILLTSCAGKREIVSNIPEKEANEIVVFLASKGIHAEKMQQATTGAGGGEAAAPMYTIMVPASQATEALAILNRNGLPRRPGPNLLDLFKKSGLVSSAQEEQIRYQEGLAESIAATIRKIDGVIDAVVQISIPSQEQIPGEETQQEEVRAAVYVKHQGILDDPNSQLVTKIKRLVAASVVGLDYNNVTVVPDRARYVDVTLLEGTEGVPEDIKEYTTVWTIVLAKESVGRFQGIFIILCIVILFLAALVAWLVWKLFPAIQVGGGIGELFGSVYPLSLEQEEGKEDKKSSRKGFFKRKGEDETEEEEEEE